MSSYVMRPTFYEGQLLAATDLSELVDYGRARGERMTVICIGPVSSTVSRSKPKMQPMPAEPHTSGYS